MPSQKLPVPDTMPKASTRVFRDFRPTKNKNGKTLYVPKAMDQFIAYNLPDDYNFLDANPEVKETILVMVAEGKTITKACELLGVTFSIILEHAENNEEFGRRLNQARRFRAEGYHDKFANIADEVSEDSAKSSKVKSEIYKHLMAIGDKDRFSPQTKTIAESSSTVTFIVDTGVRREIEDQAIPTEGRTIGEAENARDDQDGLPAEAPPAPDSRKAEEV